ncbi:MAG TPA: hypothetical protein VFZ04_03990 [Longimicrobiales bacterium]
MTAPSVTEVERIAGLAEPAGRNREITACYHQLSRALCESLGAVANWCTFATWASRQAGSTIRGDDLRAALDQQLARATELAAVIRQAAALARQAHPAQARQLEETIRSFLRQQGALQRASAAVARGNLKVFAEIGREFARFLEAFPDAESRTPPNLQRFLATLRPGPPPDGQQLLRDAFAAYHAACTTHETQRSQLVLYANLLVGFHEQTRLQPEIREALDTARAELDGLRAPLLRLLVPSWWLRLRQAITRALGRRLPLDAAIDRIIDQVCEEIREVITAELMTLALPTGTLRLGRTQSASFPPSLQQMDYPPLVQFLARPELARTVPRPDERDWSEFSYRMHFIAQLFRAYQETPELQQPSMA